MKSQLPRYYVYTVLQSGVGRTVREPHCVIDRKTDETLDCYASKKAANMHAKELNSLHRSA